MSKGHRRVADAAVPPEVASTAPIKAAHSERSRVVPAIIGRWGGSGGPMGSMERARLLSYLPPVVMRGNKRALLAMIEWLWVAWVAMGGHECGGEAGGDAPRICKPAHVQARHVRPRADGADQVG